MGSPVADMREVPGGLFLMSHWEKLCVDLLSAVMEAYPGDTWRGHVHPQTRQWADDHMAYVEKQKRLARERALSKLTFEDKLALGLPT